MPLPRFLDLPHRSSKPRERGVTHVLDKGMSTRATQNLLDHVGRLVDIVKVGWGIAYVDPHVRARVSAYRAADVTVSLGGTLLEIAAAQGRVDELCRWASDVGVTTIEVSNGLGLIEHGRKIELVAQLSRDFVVAAEAGSKDSAVTVEPDRWVREMCEDLEAGATWVIAEGRESGTVGLYHSDGTVRETLVDRLLAELPVDRIIFEAPNKAQQAWFVRSLGPEVNLGNIAPDDVLPLETLRLGLRADTALSVVPVGLR